MRRKTPGTLVPKAFGKLDAEVNSPAVLTGMHYAGARYYMSALGRWNGPDPLADDFPAWSPQAYSYNNPIGFPDPTGRAPFVPNADGSKP